MHFTLTSGHVALERQRRQEVAGLAYLPDLGREASSKVHSFSCPSAQGHAPVAPGNRAQGVEGLCVATHFP